MKIVHLQTGKIFTSWRGAMQSTGSKDRSEFSTGDLAVICEQNLAIYPTIRDARRVHGNSVLRQRSVSGMTFRYWDTSTPLPEPKPYHKTKAQRIRINETDETFSTTYEVAFWLGATPATVSAHLQGRTKFIHGFTLTLCD